MSFADIVLILEVVLDLTALGILTGLFLLNQKG